MTPQVTNPMSKHILNLTLTIAKHPKEKSKHIRLPKNIHKSSNNFINLSIIKIYSAMLSKWFQ